MQQSIISSSVAPSATYHRIWLSLGASQVTYRAVQSQATAKRSPMTARPPVSQSAWADKY